MKVTVEEKDEAGLAALIEKTGARVLDDTRTYTLELTGANRHMDICARYLL
jgi:hypothetical protein